MSGLEIFLGLDLGTSGCKLIAFDAEGRELAKAHRAYRAVSPGPGLFELDAELVWREAEACFREVAAERLPGAVRTLAISVLGEAIVPVDKSGQALAPSPLSADLRATEETRELGEAIGPERITAMTGQPLSPHMSLPKLIWWRKHRPDLVARSWKFLCFGEFALMRLGFEPVIDEGMASRTLAYDLERRRWSPELLEKAGLDERRMAGVAESGIDLGIIAPAVAERLALPKGVHVMLGGHDQPMGALGAGIVAPGMASYALGTTEALVVALGQRSRELGRHNIPCYPHVMPGHYVGLAGSESGGRVLAWYHGILAAGGNADALDELLGRLPDSLPTWPIFLSHLAGSGSVLNDPASLGAFHGLRFGTTADDMLLAVLEGITFEQALNLETLTQIAGPVDLVRAMGGGTRSALWLQMKADILNRPIMKLPVRDAPCLGAAILGRAAIERQRPVAEIARYMVAGGQVIEPRVQRHAIYAERLDIYRSLYKALRPLASRLTAVGRHAQK
ncbi:FGGY-family carbohydrate kinase [Taklimakanibacter lacteus]|uniref:FGGY-family carbohydrate kinase n=1 Tax=Taklimakanibacter lacteus TaxID=2268456 RepID=UPI000E67425A